MRTAPLLLALVLGLAACAPQPQATGVQAPAEPAIYGARADTGPNGESIEIPAVRPAYLNERNTRQLVAYNGPDAPGTIVVDPYARLLYRVLDNGQAMRYGIAVGRAGTGFKGNATIKRKAVWPSWTPTANMVRTEPELYGHLKNGLPGGSSNPLGSRALYLYQGDRDTMYRIHGTMDPSSIGKATSAGCIRLFNQDIMDIFGETKIGTHVKVRSQAESIQLEGHQTPTPDGYLVSAQEIAAAAQ
ncbi:L,D-transpeptidase [Paracoccus aminophilus]|uniref:Protein ErfK/SrfK n=1 Tax=Paracoccus aminophilus JCM 7686 TaxID=1367847 RepID=S5XY16_PARAH|nr:L,D-transpeptidase [Paracoccus aminophilus]AGT10197.1 protein ErfK/SrfK [Paracoccus aminophilus JCM 7686]